MEERRAVREKKEKNGGKRKGRRRASLISFFFSIRFPLLSSSLASSSLASTCRIKILCSLLLLRHTERRTA